MIYVATAHYASDHWVDVQLGYLRRNMGEPYRVYASLEDVPGDHSGKFDAVVNAKGHHAGKLNLLAAEISAVARDDDVLVFLDGDAFPVVDPMPIVHAGLAATRLVAVRRGENASDVQPHPSFCAVRVGDWNSLRGDWSAGYCWSGPDGRPTTDVGGNLLRALELAGASWTPLLRSNRIDFHPLWFGIYGGIVYHHGAGFREPLSRADLLDEPAPHRLGRRVPGLAPLVERWDSARAQRFRAARKMSVEQLHADMFARLRSDPEFYRVLL
jgi:hypothetical protein